MTHENRSHLNRRTVLKSSGIALAGLGGLTSTVAAGGKGDGGKRVSLFDGPAEFQLFWSGADDPPTKAGEEAEFGFPSDPFLATEDPNDMYDDREGIFDASEIEMTPNGQTLHHTFRPLGGKLIEGGRGKPYTLINRGLVSGSPIPLYSFEAKGQILNFEAKDEGEPEMDEIIGLIGILGGDPTPITTLAGGRWRAVGSEIIYVLDEGGEPSRKAPYSVTRVDFYDRSSRPMAFALSILYVIYPNLDENGNVVPANPTNPDIRTIPMLPQATGAQFIRRGPRNQGGH